MEIKWIYFGVFLDNESKNILYNHVKEYIPQDWKIFCHHMTIAFNNKTERAQELYNNYSKYFGQEIKLEITHIGISNDAIAVKVNYMNDIQNKIPHITVAIPQNGKPVNSNYIENWKPLNKTFILNGIINVFTK